MYHYCSIGYSITGQYSIQLVQTLVNTAPLFPNAADFDAEMFKLCDILVANELEAAVLSNKQSINSIEEAKAALPIFLEMGVGTAIITLGNNGAVIAFKDRPSHSEHVAAVQTTVVDTTVRTLQRLPHVQLWRYSSNSRL